MNKNTCGKTGPTNRRAFCLVDLENLAQGSQNVCNLSRYLRSVVDTMLTTYQSHMTVVATGPNAIAQSPNIYWDWSDCRFLKGHGLDGADKELVAVLDDEPAALASSNILLWSGDGIFSDSLSRLRSLGCHISVFGPYRSISHRLYSTAHCVTELPLYLLNGETAASTTTSKTVDLDCEVAA